MKKSKFEILSEDGVWVTISSDLDIDTRIMEPQTLYVTSAKELDTMLKICNQSNKCLSIIFDFRNNKEG